MRSIIKDGQISQDRWQVLRADAEGQYPAVAADVDVIIPLGVWLADKSVWQTRAGQTAVWLSPDEDPQLLAADLNSLPLVAVDFPAFTDGRGYSLGRLLRERYNYAGELRALGDVWVDLLHYLWQVGFNAFEIKDGKDLGGALSGYDTFTERYQSTHREPVPLFRRRVTSL